MLLGMPNECLDGIFSMLEIDYDGGFCWILGMTNERLREIGIRRCRRQQFGERQCMYASPSVFGHNENLLLFAHRMRIRRREIMQTAASRGDLRLMKIAYNIGMPASGQTEAAKLGRTDILDWLEGRCDIETRAEHLGEYNGFEMLKWIIHKFLWRRSPIPSNILKRIGHHASENKWEHYFLLIEDCNSKLASTYMYHPRIQKEVMDEFVRSLRSLEPLENFIKMQKEICFNTKMALFVAAGKYYRLEILEWLANMPTAKHTFWRPSGAP